MKKALYIFQIIFASIIALFAVIALFESIRTGICWLLVAGIVSPLPNQLFPQKTKAIVRGFTKGLLAFCMFILGATFLPTREYSKVVKVEKKEKEEVAIVPFSVDTPKLEAFQSKWMSGIINENKGYLMGFSLSQQKDTIYIQLSKEASEGNWREGINGAHQRGYQHDYDSLVSSTFKDEFAMIKTTIVLLPDLEVLERTHKVKRQFATFDGSNAYLKMYVRDNMNDPSSFEHIETTYSDKGNYLLVKMKFRGKNALGTKVVNVVTAKMDIDGNVLSIQQDY